MEAAATWHRILNAIAAIQAQQPAEGEKAGGWRCWPRSAMMADTTHDSSTFAPPFSLGGGASSAVAVQAALFLGTFPGLSC